MADKRDPQKPYTSQPSYNPYGSSRPPEPKKRGWFRRLLRLIIDWF